MAKRFYQFNKKAQGETVRGTVQETGGQGSKDDEIIDLTEVSHQASDFYEKNQKLILGVIGGLILIIGGYFIYKYLIIEPKEKAAITAMYQAESQFAQDSFALALENPGGGFEGFLDIIDNYGGTATSNTAKYYAGICYLNLGKYESALEYLSDYSPKDEITPSMKSGALGDVHAELGDLDKALSMYEKAISSTENEVIAPYYLNKLGLLQFKQGKNDQAIATMKKLVETYPSAAEFGEAEKLITRLSQN